MDNNNLNKSLDNLHNELSQAQPTDKSRAIADDLRTNIKPLIEQPPSDPVHYKSLGERLNLALVDLEVDHPRLSAAIQSVLDELAAVGI